MAPKIAIVFYSMYGHISQLAEAEAKGIRDAGGEVDIYQFVPASTHPPPTSGKLMFLRIEETLPEEVLTKMHAGPKTAYPHITPAKLAEYDGFLFGIPTRYGNFPAQWKVCSRFFCRLIGMVD